MILLHTLNGLSFLGKLHLFTELCWTSPFSLMSMRMPISSTSCLRVDKGCVAVLFLSEIDHHLSGLLHIQKQMIPFRPQLSTMLCKLNYWRLMTVFLYVAWPRVVLKVWGCTRWLEMETPQPHNTRQITSQYHVLQPVCQVVMRWWMCLLRFPEASFF